MNIAILIQVNNISQLPAAIDKVAAECKSDIRIMGEQANCFGVTEEGFFYDMRVNKDSNLNNLATYLKLIS